MGGKEMRKIRWRGWRNFDRWARAFRWLVAILCTGGGGDFCAPDRFSPLAVTPILTLHYTCMGACLHTSKYLHAYFPCFFYVLLRVFVAAWFCSFILRAGKGFLRELIFDRLLDGRRRRCFLVPCEGLCISFDCTKYVGSPAEALCRSPSGGFAF